MYHLTYPTLLFLLAATALNRSRVVTAIRSELAAYEKVTNATQAAQLANYLNSNDFSAACKQTFQIVDADGSGSIDPQELAAAFQLIMEHLKVSYNKSSAAHTKALAQTLAMQTFSALDIDRSGELDSSEFLDACRMIWIKTQTLNQMKTPGEALVDGSLRNYQALAGNKAVEDLRQYFRSFDFSNLVTTVYNSVDEDGSKSIDREECSRAFQVRYFYPSCPLSLLLIII